MRARGATPIALNDSNPTHHGLAPHMLPEPYAADPRGQRYAREALAAYLGGVSAGDIYLLSSTSQAYAWLMKLLCDAGDAVLAPKPGYPLIESIARLECVEPRFYQLRFDGSWTIDTAQIEQLLRDDTGHRLSLIHI